MNKGPLEHSSAVELTLNLLQPDCFEYFHVYMHVLFITVTYTVLFVKEFLS